MAVTYPIDFPTVIGLGGFKINLRTAVARSESPFSFVEQTYDWGGQIWEIEATTPTLNRDTAEYFNSWIFKLRGKKGTFLLPIPGAETPRGSFAGTPVFDGAGQTGGTIDLDGFTPSTVGVIKAGDWFSYGTGSATRLHKFLDDADSDSSGQVTVNIAPNLRNSPADGTAIVTSSPKGLFRLAENTNGYEINSDNFYILSFRAVEALNGS